MCLRLRNTARRGRAVVPSRCSRIRLWRFSRAADRVATCVISSVRSLLLAADLAGLAGLAADLLAGVAHALALVGLRLAGRANLRRDLADELLVDADDREAGRVLELEADAVRRLDLDLVAVAQAQLELLADLDGAIADTGDLEARPIALGDADDHVVDERPGQAVELLVGLLLGRPGDDDRVVLAADLHVGVELTAELALGPFHRDAPALDRDVDARRHGNGKATDTRHVVRLPDVREDFAAELGLAGLRAGHDPLAGANDDDAEAAEDARDVGLAGIDPQAGLADSLQPGHDRHLAVDVLEGQVEHERRPVLLLADVGDEAFVHEDPGDLALRPRRRHDHLGVAG